ncbi:hypothetical protein L1049_022657 [Liquidambar formosana]|uniref:Uncharacterized protein n=1 Tax=Liquidambar formosana TaxID=63359 RepID=A0AAP0WRH8_LIQFO
MEMEAQRSGEQSFPKRGRWALERYKCLEAFEWSVQIEFDKSITLWHIVTDICYYSDDCRSSTDSPSHMTKLLSDYMMYLLIVCPYMLAITTAVGDKIFQDTCDRVMEMFRDKPCMREKEACKMILGIEEATTDGSISKWNILPSGQELARTLMDKEDKWKIISRVWVEMLCYAACHCQVNYHAQHLRRGGELITNVWLLLLPMTAHPSKT